MVINRTAALYKRVKDSWGELVKVDSNGNYAKDSNGNYTTYYGNTLTKNSEGNYTYGLYVFDDEFRWLGNVNQ